MGNETPMFKTFTHIGRNGAHHGPSVYEGRVRNAYVAAAKYAKIRHHVVFAVTDEDFGFGTCPESEALDLGIDSGLTVTNEDHAVRLWWREYGSPAWGPDAEEPDPEFIAHFAKFQ